MPSPDDDLTVTFPARLWSRIDATIDNSVSMAHVDGDADIYQPGQRVREAGWKALRGAPETDDLGWPPGDYQLPITAKRRDWAFVLTQLDRWEPYDTGGEESFHPSARQIIESALQG